MKLVEDKNLMVVSWETSAIWWTNSAAFLSFKYDSPTSSHLALSSLQSIVQDLKDMWYFAMQWAFRNKMFIRAFSCDFSWIIALAAWHLVTTGLSAMDLAALCCSDNLWDFRASRRQLLHPVTNFPLFSVIFAICTIHQVLIFTVQQPRPTRLPTGKKIACSSSLLIHFLSFLYLLWFTFPLNWSLTRLDTFTPTYHNDLLNLMIFINCTCMFTSANYQLIRSNCTDSNVHGNEKSVPSTPVEK